MQVFPLKTATNSDVDYILQFASPSDDCLATADVINMTRTWYLSYRCHPGHIYIQKALACKASQGFTF